MDTRSIQDLRSFVTEISNKLAAADRFFTARLATRLTKAAEQDNNDHTIVQMAAFLRRRAETPGGHLISRAELIDVYNRLYTTNTKCASYLEDELGGIKANNLPAPRASQRSEREGETIDDLYSRHADQKLVAQLESVFDKNTTYKGYNPVIGEKAARIVSAALPGNPEVKAVDGRDFAILCQANYKTPKGNTSVLVPVEIINNHPAVPNVFLTPAGFENLTHKLVETHVVRTAGKNFRVNAEQVFDVIKKAKAIAAGEPETDGLDSVDAAVLSFKAKTGRNDITPEGILYQAVDKEVKDVAVPELKQAKSFGEQLKSVAGQAEYVFGEKAVGMGRFWIQSGLENLGYSNPQVKVADIRDDAIIYAVSVGGNGFKVPVKVSKGRAEPPRVIIVASGVESFDDVGIKNAIGAKDLKANAVALGYDLSDSASLIKEVQAACEVGDLNRAGEAVKALSATGDETATKYAFDMYMQALDGKKVASAPKMKTIKIGGNIVEATTGLPVDQVYVDERGQVQRKIRQHQDKTDSNFAAGFMNAKIIMGM